MSLLDDFRAWSDGPVRSRLVGERVTGVELVTDNVEANPDGEALAFDVDVAVTVRTAHGAYTFARESWESTGIAICEGDGAGALEAADARNAKWLEAHPNLGAVKVTRSADKLA